MGASKAAVGWLTVTFGPGLGRSCEADREVASRLRRADDAEQVRHTADIPEDVSDQCERVGAVGPVARRNEVPFRDGANRVRGQSDVAPAELIEADSRRSFEAESRGMPDPIVELSLGPTSRRGS